ncbi:hypothetical protein NIES4074_09770 [Cylindrospermum sp. NIES-4074]|nr:hypothetical protein NIES4074_09770 [Cylindrospermum sp. NIES-4074]
MADIKDLSQIIASKGDKPLLFLSVKLLLPGDGELELKLRELKAKQELRKDWILFIVRDVVAFAVGILFMFAVGGYSLFTLINR